MQSSAHDRDLGRCQQLPSRPLVDLNWPGTSNRRGPASVSDETPTLASADSIAAHCDGYPDWPSKTIRTAEPSAPARTYWDVT